MDGKISLTNFNDLSYELQLETRNWRNRECVAKFFKIPYIEEEVHKKWLEKLKEPNPKSLAFVISSENNYFGVTYFHSIDYVAKNADWGIYLYDDIFRGQGIGTKVLAECIKYAANTLELKVLYLDVLETNERAKRLYTNFGFIQIESDDLKFLRFKKEL